MLKFGDKTVRDSKGHTYCPVCGKVITNREEKYCKEHLDGKIICFNCQKKEGVDNE